MAKPNNRDGYVLLSLDSGMEIQIVLFMILCCKADKVIY